MIMTMTQNQSQLEQALPSEVSIQSDTWLNRYRNYPVFSRTWFKQRSIAFGISLIALFLTGLGATFLSKSGYASFFVVAVPGFIGITFLCFTGQALAVWVKSQKFSFRKEAILISLALLFGAIFSAAISVGSEYVAGSIFKEEVKAYELRMQKHQKINSEMKAQIESEAAANTTIKSIAPVNKEAEDFIKGNIRKVIILIFQIFPFAILLIYAGSGFDLWVFFRQRKRLIDALLQQEFKQTQEARREAELRLSVLVAQVEPHFLFNTLAGVRSAILTEPLRATVIVDHLVDYLRSTIPNMRNDGTSNQGRLEQQLEAVKAYLGLMQARIPRLSFQVESELKDAALPPLILISLVENAIKHGIEPKIGSAHITVTAKIIDQDDDEFLEISVIDNGVGFGGTTSGSGIGLNNIRERLDSIYGKQASLTLKTRPEGGVNATIVLPLAM